MKNFKSISQVRTSIDKIDSKLLDLIYKRKLLVEQAVKLKKKSQIVDKKRIQEILDKLELESRKKKIPEGLIAKIWKIMIKGFISYEREIYDKVHKK
tara:strand:- start:106 stop:396 length:291 start_codon:yes stop_codon:yes gene_type:complete